MPRLVVSEERVGAPGELVASPLEYLLSERWNREAGWEILNICSGDGPFGARGCVVRFARARAHTLPGLPAAPSPARTTPTQGPLGVLHTPDLPCGPSTAQTLAHLERLAGARGVAIRWLRADQIREVEALGALLIRDDTSILNHTLRFARRAAELGIPVIDRPEAIELASDKALMAQRFAARGLPTPDTLLLHAGNAAEIVDALGYPFVLKRVDGSWSHAVWRVDGPEDLARKLPVALEGRLLAVAQRYTPTPFDWRVGVLDGELFFAARYHAVPGHWQVAAWDGDRLLASGRTEALPLAELPAEVGALALEATAVFGAGLYGVDLKPGPRGPLLIEVNDCVDLDLGCEDAAEGDRVYHRLLDALGYGP